MGPIRQRLEFSQSDEDEANSIETETGLNELDSPVQSHAKENQDVRKIGRASCRERV